VYIVLIIGLTLFEEPGLGYGRVGIARASSSRDVTNRDRPKKKKAGKVCHHVGPRAKSQVFPTAAEKKNPHAHGG